MTSTGSTDSASNVSTTTSRTLSHPSRRAFGQRALWTGIGLLGATCGLTGAPRRTATAAHHDVPFPTASQFEKSPFVYISPLLEDGRESSCHAELWYGWLDDSIVVTVARDGWKATALDRGHTQARIWVGDHGRWKTWYGGRNEAFRNAPHFDARGEETRDPKLLDRLLALYETKYPEEIASWRDAMRNGSADGSRTLLRYTPAGT
jgi:hypothetical protein